MRIGGLNLGQANGLGLGLKPGATESQDAGALPPLGEGVGPAPGASSALSDILAHYDVRNISPREFSELVRKLHDSGEISAADLKELNQIRAQLDQRNVPADQPIDLLGILQRQLKESRQKAQEAPDQGGPDRAAALKSGLGMLERQVDWLEKFSLVHSGAAFQAVA